MRRLPVVLGVMILCGVVAVAVGQTGDAKKEGGDPPKKNVQLPTGWKKLGITDEQKKKIYAVRYKYAAEIQKLNEKIEAMKKEEYTEMFKLLSDEQKALARKLALEKLPDDKAPDEKDKKDKKPGDK